jgi:hypothetical protein
MVSTMDLICGEEVGIDHENRQDRTFSFFVEGRLAWRGSSST